MNTVSRVNHSLIRTWVRIGSRFMPFADAATAELPMARLLRLSLFQVSVGMALALLNGTLNRVMIVELNVPAWLVASMVALPLLFAPMRALLGYRSDNHRSALGWKRVPYIWMGTLLQFGGLAIMPFALLVLSGDTHGPAIYGQIGTALAFLLVGAGWHTTQTAGLALATDIAPPESRPRVVALLYVMLLAGVLISSLVFGALLADFKQVKLIQVIQGAGLLTMVFNLVALWKQEARDPDRTSVIRHIAIPKFRDSWRAYITNGRALRLLVIVGLGTAAFGMQDILLEPYGGHVLKLSVAGTATLTALLAGGALAALALASRWLYHGGDPYWLAAISCVAGIFGFAGVILADSMHSSLMFRFGAILIGFGCGGFSVATLIAAMGMESNEHNGLALGAWGAVQATAGGLSIAMGGLISDMVTALAASGTFGHATLSPALGYNVVYNLEIMLLIATLVVMAPMLRRTETFNLPHPRKFGLADLPG
jgi:BCD family chlorophyll transporter-like MFS transporter